MIRKVPWVLQQAARTSTQAYVRNVQVCVGSVNSRPTKTIFARVSLLNKLLQSKSCIQVVPCLCVALVSGVIVAISTRFRNPVRVGRDEVEVSHDDVVHLWVVSLTKFPQLRIPCFCALGVQIHSVNMQGTFRTS